jgi:iron complex transport system substrate-binding protein
MGSARAAQRTSALLLGAAVLATLTACGGNEPIQQPMATIATTTTRLASANIVGLDRKAAQACAAPTRAAGAPATIAVADPALLDGLCALGLQDRLVGVAGGAPAYLGDKIAGLAHLTSPTDAALTIGTTDSAAANTALGRTRVLPSPTKDWRATFTALAAAVRMPTEGRAVLDAYNTAASQAATKTDAVTTQVSLVRFTADGRAWAMGTAPLCAQVLADLTAQRPQPQRTPAPVPMTDGDYSAAEGDLIYVSLQGAGGKRTGLAAMESTPWKELRAVTAKRQLLVQDEVWYATGGPVAASAILTDLTNTINSSS